MDKRHLEKSIANGKSIREISSEHGLSYTSVRYWLKKHGLKTSYAGKEPHEHACKCGESDPTNFYGKMRSICKKCFVSRDLEISREKKSKAVAYMGGSCQCCGYDRYQGALQFHHINREDKSDWTNLRNWGWNRIKAELRKCVLVCGNCHSEIHGGVIDESKLQAGPPACSGL